MIHLKILQNLKNYMTLNAKQLDREIADGKTNREGQKIS